MYSKKLSSHHNITGPQLICLLTIANEQPVTASRIARAIHLSASTVVGVLDRLEEKGLIHRERDKKDRRRVHISLTEEGQRVALQAPPPLQDKLSHALVGLPAGEQSAIAVAFEKVVELMEVSDGNLGSIVSVETFSHG